ncbi:serine/threonine protein kinase [Antribacter sp. KLBMP9083]|uniref:Serine/threonine protein kinase n=1 Tax=Antribacter soli TaxID=2910976 RepID=A0AA41U811_9MICO|nr:serine/threonine-protein kinase [Antribacter soli]MCF4122176.1 serine/threonine protein kinase [Antribacter soli]
MTEAQPAEANQPSEVPAVVGGYTIDAPIGSGAMGAVYRAHDDGGNPVAIKLLHRHLDDPSARERLRREARALQKLRHPAVAAVLDAELDGAEAFIVTELVLGPTLEEEVDNRGALDARDLFELADQLADALEAVHSAGVVHRDLTPSNVLISEHGPVLIDFGLAQNLGDARATRTGFVMGTPGYLAPELLDGAEPGPDTDWWSWAAVLAFAGTGRPPFGVRPTEAVLRRSREGRVDLIGLPSRSARALGAALRAEPEKRWGPTEVARALRRASEEYQAVLAGAGGDDTQELGSATDVLGAGATQVLDGAGGAGGGTLRLVGGADAAAALAAAGDTAVLPKGDTPAAALGAAGAVAAGSPTSPASGRSGRSVTGRAVGMPVRPLGEDRYRAVGDVPPEPEDEPVRAYRGRGPAAVVATGSGAVPVVVPPVMAASRRMFARRPGTVAALALPLVLIGATRPGTAFAALVGLVLLSRFTGITVDEFHRRRERRATRRGDGLVAVLAAPWHLVRAAFAVLPSVLVAACAGVLVVIIGFWLLAPGRLILVPVNTVEARSAGGMNDPVTDTWVLLLATVVVVLVAWFGPAAMGTRVGARPLLAILAPGAVGAVAFVVLALVAAWFIVSAIFEGAPVVDWWPFPGRPELR